MSRSYDIVIIGAGITGSMLAMKLSKYKLGIAVVEATCDLAGGATRANSAIVHAGFDALPGTLKAKLNARGCAELPEIARRLDVPYKNNTSPLSVRRMRKRCTSCSNAVSRTAFPDSR